MDLSLDLCVHFFFNRFQLLICLLDLILDLKINETEEC